MLINLDLLSHILKEEVRAVMIVILLLLCNVKKVQLFFVFSKNTLSFLGHVSIESQVS